ADQHHADTHASLERNGINRIGLAAQSGEGAARVGEGIHTNTEPRYSVAARDSEKTEGQNHRNSNTGRLVGYGSQPSEIGDDHDRDESPKDQDELTLRNEISLAGFVNQFRNL